MKKHRKSGLHAAYRAFKLVVFKSPVSFFLKLLLALSVGAAGGLLTPANAYLFSSAEKAATGTGEVSQIVVGAVLVLTVMLFSQLISTFKKLITARIDQKLSLGVLRFFYDKVGNIPAIRFEEPNFLQTIDKATESSNVVISLVDIWMQSFGSFISYFVIMSSVLISMDFALVGALLLTFFPSVLLNFILPTIEEKGNDEARPYELRQTQYREDARSPHDTRIFGAFAFFDRLYYDNRKKQYKIERKADLKIQWIAFLFQLTKAAGWVGVLLLLVQLISAGRVTSGEGAAVFASISTMYSYFESLFKGFRYTSELEPYVNSFFQFIDETAEGEEKEAVVPEIMQHGIKAENISFTYPGAKERAVDDVTLEIRPGELLAVVGENGSGKTTLSKLLMGVYSPDEGDVKIGGRSANNTARSTLFSRTSAIFQNYIHYTALTLSDNVILSSPEEESEKDSVELTLSKCALDVSSFPKGLSTMLGREFDGVELSGGQWQRLAMARALYRSSEWLIMDEPTAAIDPLEEDRLYRSFKVFAEGKTAFLITHRLGSARIADRIIVMDHGKIVEEGQHDELLKRNGKYAELWEAQASNYHE